MKKALLTVVSLLILGIVCKYLFFEFRFRGIRHGQIIVETNLCEDNCPKSVRDRSWGLIYYNIKTKEDCLKIGGEVIVSNAWGGFYRACGVE